MPRIKIFYIGSIVVLALVAACASEERDPAQREETPPRVENRTPDAVVSPDASTEGGVARAAAMIAAKSGSKISGQALFVAEGGQVRFDVQIEKATSGLHAVHIHEIGDCSASDASSAGAHWNPEDVDHGEWGDESFHLGDIGNIEVGEAGDGSLNFTTARWTLELGERSVIDKAIVVHSGADDFTTQPDGAAGERIGCGVIQPKRES